MNPETYIHFRYHDAVNGLIGRHRYRYEVHQYGDLEGLVKSLAPKGMDEFSWRPLRSLESWHSVEHVYA